MRPTATQGRTAPKPARVANDTAASRARAEPVPTRSKPKSIRKSWTSRITAINLTLGTNMSAAEMIEMGLKPFDDEWWG